MARTPAVATLNKSIPKPFRYKMGNSEWQLHLKPQHSTNNGNRLKETKEIIGIMEQKGIPLSHSFLTNNKDVDIAAGKQFHARLIKIGQKMGVYFSTKLLVTYAKYGRMEDARQIFDKMCKRNVVSWTAMISGYVHGKLLDEALELFKRMQYHLEPNHFTFSSVLSACTEEEEGKQIHSRVIIGGLESDLVLGNGFIGMYVKCRCMEDARKVFDKMSHRNVVSWTTIVAGYAKYGFLEEARLMFDETPQRNVVSWNALIAGYAQHGHGDQALILYWQLRQSGMALSCSTFATILSVCSDIAALEQGKLVHAHMVKCCLYEEDVVLGSSLVDMYGKCGSIKDAEQVFDEMPEKNVISWTAMIDGFGKHGQAKAALQLFQQMEQVGVQPNHVTFLSVLCACSHAGLVEEGLHLFDCMYKHYHITPGLEHYASMVDLLGRAGRLEEAHSFINKLPTGVEPGAEVWGALLGACRVHNNIRLGNLAAQHLCQLNPQNTGTYVALSGVYAAAGMWDNAAKVIKIMKDKGIKTQPGCSWIEVRKQVHFFRVGDRSHPQTEQIYATLENLTRQMKQFGYVPELDLVFHDMEKEQKEHILSLHSEKLAIAFGLISTPPGALLRIIKNLRVCIDCHNAIKIISKIVDREIVVRDANRFHHFKNGLCSCGDYW